MNDEIEYPSWKWEVFVGLSSALFLVLSLGIRMTGMLSMYLLLLLFIAMIWTISKIAYQKIKKTFPSTAQNYNSQPRERIFFFVAVLFWSLAICSAYVSLSSEILGKDSNSFLIFVLVAYVITMVGSWFSIRPTWSKIILFAMGCIFVGNDMIDVFGKIDGEEIEVYPPFRGKWAVIQGGATPLLNHHYPIPQQRGALDLMLIQDGAVMPEEALQNTDHYSWNQKLYAPNSGLIAKVVQDFEDIEGFSLDVQNPAGNYIVLQLDSGHYATLAHLQQGSILVKEGERVKCGQEIARVGNTGNTTQPHIHVQIQSQIDFMDEESIALPILFLGTKHIRNGTELKENQQIRRTDILETIDTSICTPSK